MGGLGRVVFLERGTARVGLDGTVHSLPRGMLCVSQASLALRGSEICGGLPRIAREPGAPCRKPRADARALRRKVHAQIPPDTQRYRFNTAAQLHNDVDRTTTHDHLQLQVGVACRRSPTGAPDRVGHQQLGGPDNQAPTLAGGRPDETTRLTYSLSPSPLTYAGLSHISSVTDGKGQQGQSALGAISASTVSGATTLGTRAIACGGLAGAVSQ